MNASDALEQFRRDTDSKTYTEAVGRWFDELEWSQMDVMRSNNLSDTRLYWLARLMDATSNGE